MPDDLPRDRRPSNPLDPDALLRAAADHGRSAAHPAAPSAIRGIGTRMRRTRAAVTATCSAVVVVGVVGVVSSLATPTALPPDVADTTSTPGPTASGTPGPGPTATGITPDPTLEALLLSEEELTHYAAAPDPQPVEPDVDLLGPCSAVSYDVGATGWVSQAYGWANDGSGGQSVITQAIVEYEDDAAAERGFAAVRDGYATCAGTSEVTANGTGPGLLQSYDVAGLGDAASFAAILLPWADGQPLDEGRYLVARVARTGATITWTAHTFPGVEYYSRPEPEVMPLAVERICAETGTTCSDGSAPLAYTQTWPEAASDVPGMITADDVIGAVGGRWRGLETEPLELSPQVVCAPTFTALGAGDVVAVAFQDEDASPVDPVIQSVTMERATFETAGEADGYLQALRDAWSATCGDGELPEPVEGVDDAWAYTFDGGTSIYAFVAVDRRVAYVHWNTFTLDPGTITQLTDVMRERLAQLD